MRPYAFGMAYLAYVATIFESFVDGALFSRPRLSLRTPTKNTFFSRPSAPAVEPATEPVTKRRYMRPVRRAYVTRKLRVRRRLRRFSALRKQQRGALADVWLYARGVRSAEERTTDLADQLLAPSVKPAPRSSRPLRILSLDGGGMKGRNIATMIDVLERETGAPIARSFDLVVGTSIGGCGALFVNRFGDEALAASKLAFARLQTRCFEPRKRHHFFLKGHTCVDERSALVRELCGDERLVPEPRSWSRLLRENVDAARAGARAAAATLPFVDAPPRKPAGLAARRPGAPRAAAVAATRDAATGRPAPFLFRTYALDGAPLRGTDDATFAEAVAATSAAPTFFPRSELRLAEHDVALTDGGVAFNNPTLLALVEAKTIWPDAEVGCVVSLGTGRLDDGKQTHEELTHAHAEAVLAARAPGAVYARFDPPLDKATGCAEAREDVLAAMERATRAWLREDPGERAKLGRVVAALADDRSWDALINDGLRAGLRAAQGGALGG